eukprot:XP_001705006.1 Hypothetical protein GL50803_31535 [Giardia lamblia ATCC 50803]
MVDEEYSALGSIPRDSHVLLKADFFSCIIKFKINYGVSMQHVDGCTEQEAGDAGQRA